MEKKKVSWKFDPESSMMYVSKDGSVSADLEARFKFKLEIFKDSETHVESMKITNYVIDKAVVEAGEWESEVGTENGAIITSVVNLPQDIKKFKQFGVVIGDTYFRDFAKRIIEDEYLNIRVDTVTFSKNDTRYSDLLAEIKRFFTEFNDSDKDSGYITDDFCNIPVNLFNGLASDCGYSEYEMKNLRVQLHQNEDIYVDEVSGRYAILKRISGKPERVIAFYRKKLGIEIREKQEKKGRRKSVKGEEK